MFLCLGGLFVWRWVGFTVVELNLSCMTRQQSPLSSLSLSLSSLFLSPSPPFSLSLSLSPSLSLSLSLSSSLDAVALHWVSG